MSDSDYDDQRTTQLHLAAQAGDSDKVQRMIDQGKNVNCVDHNYRTPLMFAVTAKSQKTVKALLKANANIHLYNHLIICALQMVFEDDKFDVGVGREFIRHVCNLPLPRSPECPTWVMNSSIVLRPVGVQIWDPLDTWKGYNTKILAYAGCTLYHAVYLGDIELVSALMKLGIDINSSGPKSRTALHAAVEIADLKMVKWLIENGGNVNELDNEHLTPLYLLYKSNCEQSTERLGILQLLIDQGTNLTYFTLEIYGRPQLWPIVKYGCREAKRILLQNSEIEVDTTIARDGRCLLHYLAKQNYAHVIEILEGIENLRVNLLDIFGRSPLFVAAKYGNTAMVKFLIEKGADPNSKTYIGRMYKPLVGTFLKESRTKQHVECTRLLLEAGANPQISKYSVRKIFESTDKRQVHMIIAHLAMMKMVTEYTREKIESDFQWKRYYKSCKKVLNIEVFESFTLYDLLEATDVRLKGQLRDDMFVEKVKRFCKYELRQDYSYYYKMLKQRVDKLWYVVKLEYKAVATLNEIVSWYPMHHVVIQLIMPYLEIRDMEILCEPFMDK